MRNICLFLGVIGLQSVPVLSHAQSTTVSALRYWTQQEEARLVFDVSALSEHNIYTLQNPARLVVDFKGAKLGHKIGQPSGNNAFFANIETGIFNDENLRVVIELKKNIVFKDFTLTPNKTYGNRLVVDIYDSTGLTSNNAQPGNDIKKLNPVKMTSTDAPKISATANSTGIKVVQNQSESAKVVGKVSVPSNAQKNNDNSAAVTESVAKIQPDTNKSVIYAPKARTKEVIVAIDAGHGGEDPGAHGAGGTEEKRVVLAIARKLETLIRKHPGMTPVMVREGDYFIKLRKRIDIARAAKADLFVSIHADAYRDASVKGSSVFTLSNHGASSEAARWLADSENASDLIGGVSLDDKDDMLASVLLDLSQTATLEASSDVARKVLTNFKQVNSLHKSAVQKAGFLVLKSPDIPSILVETAFISNPSEEVRLRSEDHQEKMATAIFKGIVAYFKQHVPTAVPTMHMATASLGKEKSAARHEVVSGETLSGIAQRYGISTRELKSANAIDTGSVRAGQMLRIPTDT